MRYWLVAPAVAALFAATAACAQARPARCVIASAGVPTYRGPCDFTPERGGSFAVSPSRIANFPNGVSIISLFITGPGVGEVRGLTRQGINSRWGTARRSGRDRACWIGADFSICVY